MKAWMLAIGLALGLVACAQTGSVRNDAYRQIAVKDEKIIAHFQLDGQYAANAVGNGYYRKLLGMTQNEDWIVQDFYSRNDQKQSDPLKIQKGGNVQSFSNSHTDGEVFLYYANGARLESSVYESGQLVGTSTAYYPNGTVFHVSLFEKGQLNGRSQYFNDSGKLAANLEFTEGKLIHAEAWDLQTQQPIAKAQLPEFLQRLQEQDTANMQELLRLAQ